MLQRLNTASSNGIVQWRTLRNWWRQPYLKDLYNRRQMIGADPVLPRSAYPNWNYPAELSAFKHRINVPELKTEELTEIFTNPTYFDRADELGVRDVAEGEVKDNSKFVDRGEHRIVWQLMAVLRRQWPDAPEEFVRAVTNQLSGAAQLRQVADQLGIPHLVQTAEFPASDESVVDALHALVGALDPKRVHGFVADFVLPQLAQLAPEDALPFEEPLLVAASYLRNVGHAKEVEPRLIHSHGVNSAMPLYVVGLYADKRLIAQSPGESLSIATDLAAQAALLEVWGVCVPEQSYAFLDEQLSEHHFEKPNHHLADVVDKGTNLNLLSPQQLQQDPINVFQIAHNFEQNIRAEVGLPLRRRLRHKFSRGSLAKRSLRRLIKPKVFTI